MREPEPLLSRPPPPPETGSMSHWDTKVQEVDIVLTKRESPKKVEIFNGSKTLELRNSETSGTPFLGYFSPVTKTKGARKITDVSHKKPHTEGRTSPPRLLEEEVLSVILFGFVFVRQVRVSVGRRSTNWGIYS